MDRSFLLKPEVVSAARNFVCIRLTSYEDETEKQFIGNLVRGDVANTSFGLLTPEGELALRGRGPGRGPKDLFPDAAAMARGMDELAAKYPAKPGDKVPSLPVALNAKVGFAVAAGDNQPLVIVLAKDESQRRQLEAKVARLAWSKAFEGRFVYALASGADELPKIQGKTIQEGVLTIEPDIFGIGGKVISEVTLDQADQKLFAVLDETRKKFVPTPKNRRDLAVLGLQEGIYYETGIPVSGKGEAADRERYKKKLDSKKKN